MLLKTIAHYWKKEEMPFWAPFYTKKGFATWENWRNTCLHNAGITLRHKTWRCLPIQKKHIKHLHHGPFPGWKQIGQDMHTSNMTQLINHPILKENKKIQTIKKTLPKTIVFIGLYNKGEITLLDGHHRCIALLQKNNIHMYTPKLFIILGK